MTIQNSVRLKDNQCFASLRLFVPFTAILSTNTCPGLGWRPDWRDSGLRWTLKDSDNERAHANSGARHGADDHQLAQTQVGTIQDPAIVESSGLVASRRYPGVFWTHNDSGSAAVIFAINQRGQTLGRFPVQRLSVVDLEDIAIDGNGKLYLADIGADGRSRDKVTVYRLREPNPRGTERVLVERGWSLKFPGNREDAESFFVLNDVGYLITKRAKGGYVTIYRFSLNNSANPIVLQQVTRIRVVGDVTAADVSVDRQRLGLVTEKGVYIFLIRGNVAAAARAPRTFTPFEHDSTEGGTFVGHSFLVSAETRELILFP
jgi:phage tail tape-measure protein